MPKGAGKKRIKIIPAIHGKLTRDGKVCEPDIHWILEKWPERHPEIKKRQKDILLNDDQRRRLGVKGKTLDRKRLEEIDYHGERNRSWLGNKIIEPSHEVGRTEGVIQCGERLGGQLRYYFRDAA